MRKHSLYCGSKQRTKRIYGLQAGLGISRNPGTFQPKIYKHSEQNKVHSASGAQSSIFLLSTLQNG